MSDGDLVAAAARLAAEGRQVTSDLIALLAVLVERKLYAAEGYGTAHDFCTRRLLLSDAQAYHRLSAAHVAWRFPAVLPALREGRLTLTNLALLRPHLTEANVAAVLAWAEGRGKREVEQFVRGLAPLPDVAPSLRRVPTTRPAPAVATDTAESLVPGPVNSEPSRQVAVATPASPGGQVDLERRVDSGAGSLLSREPHTDKTVATFGAPQVEGAPGVDGPSNSSRSIGLPTPRPVEIRPLTPTRYSLRLTISEATHAKLRRAADLLGHAVPGGDLAEVLDRALTLLVEQLERTKYAARKPTTADASASPSPPRRNRHQRRPATTRVTPGTGSPSADQGAETVSSRPNPAGATTSRKSRSRYIPAAVRREVWARDGGCCTYVGPGGRCGQTRRLEFHHRQPFAEGGPPTAANLTLACATHNHLEAARWFGDFDRSKRSDQTRETAGRGS